MKHTLLKLKRVYNGLKSLRHDTRHMIPMEMYKGMGHVLVKTYSALHESAQSVLTDDAFVDALTINMTDEATDRQKAIQINILAGQLLSYVEGMYQELEEQLENEGLTSEPGDSGERTLRRFNDMMDK